MEQTGYVLEKDSEYSQKILEDEEEVSISISQKGGRTAQHQVTSAPRSSNAVSAWRWSGIRARYLLLRLFQEVILRDPSSGWDLGPDLDHFSSRTRQVLQYMNPNKINMDLLVDLIDYLGTTRDPARFRTRCRLPSVTFRPFSHSVQTNRHSLRGWTAPSSCFCRAWLTSSSSTTCSPRTRGSGTETGDIRGPV